jgi:hypothetical protein
MLPRVIFPGVAQRLDRGWNRVWLRMHIIRLTVARAPRQPKKRDVGCAKRHGYLWGRSPARHGTKPGIAGSVPARTLRPSLTPLARAATIFERTAKSCGSRTPMQAQGPIGAHRVRAKRGPMAGSGVIRHLGDQDLGDQGGGSRCALRAIKLPRK